MQCSCRGATPLPNPQKIISRNPIPTLKPRTLRPVQDLDKDRQNASGNRRYQEVHRDLPAGRRLLCPDQEEQQEPADQVQGPLPEVPLHLGPEGLGEGREAQAEPAAQPPDQGRPQEEQAEGDMS